MSGDTPLNDRAEPGAQQRIQLHDSWKPHLVDVLASDGMQALRQFISQRGRAGAVILPPPRLFFAALDHTPFDQVKVVILGQDPYHGPGQAHGLSFSVLPGVRVPPSLSNIYAEIESDLRITRPDHGCLMPWAERGVLLLNAVLSVEQGQAGSHAGKGWEAFTDAVIDSLNRERKGLVFVLWGSYAQKKGAIIDRQRHCVLRAPHPSPLSAHRGFLGCGHFGKANRYLQAKGKTPIDWSLPPARQLMV